MFGIDPNTKPEVLFLIIPITILLLVVGFNLGNNNTLLAQSGQFSQLQETSRNQAILQFQMQFCGTNSTQNSNSFITEYLLPQKCEVPLGILAENDSIWYVSTKLGNLGKLNTVDNSTLEYPTPVWESRSRPTDISLAWDMKSDSNGNIWFTDEKQNGIWRFEKEGSSFSFFPIPERPLESGTIYPVSIAFNDDEIYIAGIRSKSLWMANVSDLKNNSTEGMSNISLPLSSFKGIDPYLVSTGSIEVDKERNVLWISLLSFAVKGQLFKFDLSSRTFTPYDLPPHLNSPVGIAIDKKGNPWVTDHGTSIFFMVNSTDGKVTEYSTSPLFSNSASGPNSFGTTLPYWIKMDPTGNLWFNEHIGNKIARFNTTDNTLVEYWIPTQNKLWPPGISNAVQFSIGKNNQIWFSEWTENKLGMLDRSKALPFVVDTTTTEYAAKKGDTIQVPLVISAKEQVNLKMIASSTFAKTGSFGNSTFSFSQESFSMNSGETKDITFLVTPSEDLPIGDYTIMIGAENEEVSYMDSVKVHIS